MTSAEDDFDEAARASVSEILEQQEAQTVQEADSSTVDAAVRQQPDASTRCAYHGTVSAIVILYFARSSCLQWPQGTQWSDWC